MDRALINSGRLFEEAGNGEIGCGEPSPLRGGGGGVSASVVVGGGLNGIVETSAMLSLLGSVGFKVCRYKVASFSTCPATS